MSIATATQPRRSVRLIREGYVHEGFARRSGETVVVDEATADRLVALGFAGPSITVRALRSNIMIAGHVLAFGQTCSVPWEWKSNVIEKFKNWELDAAELPGLEGDLKRAPRPRPAKGVVRLRGLKPGKDGFRQFAPGEIWDAPEAEARSLIASGLAEKVTVPEAAPAATVRCIVRSVMTSGMRSIRAGEELELDVATARRLLAQEVIDLVEGQTLPPVQRKRYRATKDGAVIGNRFCVAGEVVEVEGEEAEHASRRNDCVFAGDVPATRAKK